MSERIPYAEKLKDPRWQKKRLKVMEYAAWKCQICATKDRTLHVHHSYYTKGKEPWQYPDGSLICICHDCHEKIHGRNQESSAELQRKLAIQQRIETEAEIERHKNDVYVKPVDVRSSFAAMRAAILNA